MMKVSFSLDSDMVNPFHSSLDFDEGPLNLLFCVYMDTKGPFFWPQVPSKIYMQGCIYDGYISQIHGFFFFSPKVLYSFRFISFFFIEKIPEIFLGHSDEYIFFQMHICL